ncbi:MAG: DUF481 domain-containing protein, partial [Gemmatimonadota bacterium]
MKLRSLLVWVLALLAAAGSAQAQEFLIHANGDSINAEIKSFERGKLSYEIPGSSSASLEFDKVATLGSPEDWDIELTQQRQLFGSIIPGESGTVRIATLSDTVDVAISEIVKMTNVNKTLWSRFDGYLELGFNYAKANNATNLNFATRIDYRAPKWIFGLGFDSRFQDQDDAESFKRNLGTLNATYLLPKTWYVGAFTQFE